MPRVLVADDNDDSAQMLATFLGLFGYAVHTAADGQAALAALEASPADVAILDLGMPRMDGYEVARRLADQPFRPPLLIALSGYSRDEDRRRTAEAGFDHHLVKPVDPERLHALIQDALQARGSGS